MAEFRVLPMTVEEARARALAEERSSARNADWCVERIKDSGDPVWRWLAPQLRAAYAVHPQVAERVSALLEVPKARFGIRLPGAQAQPMERLRAALALLWLGVDSGLDVVAQAIEGNDPALRVFALEAVGIGREDLAWPDRYYATLFESCRRVYDSTPLAERWDILSAMFNHPVPVLADAMRALLANATDVRQKRAAMWLLQQGHVDDVRAYVAHIVAAPFPLVQAERAAWYSAVQDWMTELQHYYTDAADAPAARAWAAATVLALLDRLLGAAAVPGEPGIAERESTVTRALHAIEADIGPEAFALLARWAGANPPGTWKRLYALAQYARYAGAASVGLLLAELPVTGLRCQGELVRLLMAVAPASRYAELAPTVRALFDAVGPQEEDSDGHSEEQEALAGFAAALAQFDPSAAPQIAARLRELGPVQAREVRWALEGRTTARIAALLAVGGAIAPLSRRQLQSCTSEGGLVRTLLDVQKRLATLNSREDVIDTPAVQTLKKLAQIAVPPLALEDAMAANSGGLQFVHAGRVFAICNVAEDDCAGAAAAFNDFLAHLDHPQRVFEIGNDGGETDNEMATFFCADPLRMPAVAAQLGFSITLAG